MPSPNRKELALPITYPGIERVPIHYANQFVLQRQRDEFILTVAQIAPPLIFGRDEKAREDQVRQLTDIPANVVARIAMSRARLEELQRLVERQLKLHEQEQGDEAESD